MVRAVLATVAALVFISPRFATAQAIDPAAAILLEHSEVESMLGGFREGIAGALSSYSVEMTPELDALLDKHLSVAALRPIMERRFSAQEGVELRAAAAEMVQVGAISRVDRAVDEAESSMTIEEYVELIQTTPPPQERIQLVAQVAAAQAAGDFFVLVGERTREAAHRIAAAKDSTLGAFEAISDEEWGQRSQRNFMGVVVSFLHRYDSVSDELMAEALEEWQSDAGVWYVRAYSMALGETVVAAGEAIAAEIRGS